MMNQYKYFLLLLFITSSSFPLFSQQSEVSNHTFDTTIKPQPRFNYASKIGLTVTGTSLGIGYGIIALYPSQFKDWNLQVRNQVLTKHPGFKTKVDDYIQYLPGIAVVSLKLAGVKGKYPIVPSLTTFAFGGVFLMASTQGIKYGVREMRPDNSARNSFPSGHTATAFALAEWLRTEYWETSPWIGIGGYAVATSVGTLRVFNNRHWASDVVAGAAIGILCVRLAYWLKPYIVDPIYRKVPKSQGKIEWF